MLTYVACSNDKKRRIISVKGVLKMLNENLKMLRKAKGLSQEELAVKLNVVRQTISKWERGVSKI